LLAEGQIQLDYFKCPDWPDLIVEAQVYAPVAVHFDLVSAAGKLRGQNWSQVEQLLTETQTPYVNLHLTASVADYPDLPLNTSEPTHVNRVIDGLLADVWAVVDRFGPDRVIAENIPYRGTPGHHTLRPAGDPRVIRQVVQETGCGLLLDISHARMAAYYLGMDEHHYIQQLPIEKLRELHFAGVHSIEGKLRDHLAILPQDWETLEWALGNITRGDWKNPWLLAFEYGGVGEVFEWRSDPAVIREQVPKLYKLVHQPS